MRQVVFREPSWNDRVGMRWAKGPLFERPDLYPRLIPRSALTRVEESQRLDAIRRGPLAVLFSLVLRLQLTQQCPGKNDDQEETHENPKDDQNRSHEILKIRPTIPTTNTTTPIIDATNATYLCSKSCAITIKPHSNSVSKTSIDESPPNQTPKTIHFGRPILDTGTHTKAC